ncbi:MAG: alpha/beta hydrolase family protein, partial [Candidatus Dormibacteraceae bacterium]
MSSSRFAETWSSRDITTGGRYIAVAGLGNADCLLVGEGFERAPELAVIRGGRYSVIRSFDHASADHSAFIGSTQEFAWKAPDGLKIHGLVLTPKVAGPHPLIMYVHGGPVGHWRPRWLGRASVHILMLLKRGYAIFLPNPRGSSARGQDFARKVFGDMGGADARDLLSGLDALVQQRLVDPARLGVIGGSYGGFMTAWLITQDARFAAAVAVAPHTNQVSTHLCSNIPHFMTLITQDRYTNPTGKYFERSPIMHAHKARTPT